MLNLKITDVIETANSKGIITKVVAEFENKILLSYQNNTFSISACDFVDVQPFFAGKSQDDVALILADKAIKDDEFRHYAELHLTKTPLAVKPS